MNFHENIEIIIDKIIKEKYSYQVGSSIKYSLYSVNIG